MKVVWWIAAIAGLGLVWATLATLFLVFVTHDFTTCTGLTFDRAYTPMEVRPPGNARLLFVPIDEFPAAVLQELAAHYGKRYGLDVEIAPALPIPAAAVDDRRHRH